MSVHDELVALCRAMHGAGEPLTYEALRVRRGGGSRRDIGRAIRAWKQENPEVFVVKTGRPSKTETRLTEIIRRQEVTLSDNEVEIRLLRDEVESLQRMVRKYRAYPEDEQIFEDPT